MVHGSTTPPKVVPQGRPQTITSEMEEICIISYHKKLTVRHFFITLLHALLCTLISDFYWSQKPFSVRNASFLSTSNSRWENLIVVTTSPKAFKSSKQTHRNAA